MFCSSKSGGTQSHCFDCHFQFEPTAFFTTYLEPIHPLPGHRDLLGFTQSYSVYLRRYTVLDPVRSILTFHVSKPYSTLPNHNFIINVTVVRIWGYFLQSSKWRLSTVRRGDVLSAWSGIRPLVLNPNARDTQSIARNHIIEVSASNLITIAGLSFMFYCVCCFKWLM